MKPLTAESPETKSPDLVAENIAKLKALFPELVTEGPYGAAVNVDVLKQLVGDKTVTDAEEKYGLNWHGKRRARQLALTPSTGTLRPCPEDSVDWETTKNIMIEGDNLEVLKLLQKSYAGKVKLIYIDPPYNTGKDFVYPDNFQDNIKNYLELTGQVEGGRKISSNSEASGRFHTDWLNMMYPRLKLARNLLREDGVIFSSIDQRELSDLLKLFDDVFGEENALGCLIWRKKEGGGMADANFATEHEYVLAYRKSPAFAWKDEAVDQDEAEFSRSDDRGRYKLVKLAKWGNTARREDRPSMYFPITDPEGKANYPIAPDGSDGRWRVGKARLDELLRDGRVEFQKRDGKWVPYEKIYFDPTDSKALKLRSILLDTGGTTAGTNELTQLFGVKDVFHNPKPTKLISSFTNRNTSDGGAIVLDFFAGSGTTGHAVMAQNAADGGNRRYILVQLPEPLDPANKDQKAAADFCDKLGKPRNIAELTKERLRRAAKKIKEENPMFAGDLGFRVFKLDSTNIREWDPNRDNLAVSLEASVDHLKTDRTEQDILFELLLKLGLDLCVPIETKKIGEHDVHNIGAGTLLVCLSRSIPSSDVEPLALGLVAWHKELKPAGETTVVFRDSAFADDVAKTNLTAILEQNGITNVRSL